MKTQGTKKNFYGLPQNEFDKRIGCGITVGMTSTKLVSVKLPMKVFRAIPGAHKGRSRFIISALEEKISRRQEIEWQPTTERGRRLKAILDKGAAERGEPLDAEGIARELQERRGRFH
ncbi:MAG: hypothetical protein ACREFE_05915 [Limisphaerales bacterium]